MSPSWKSIYKTFILKLIFKGPNATTFTCNSSMLPINFLMGLTISESKLLNCYALHELSMGEFHANPSGFLLNYL